MKKNNQKTLFSAPGGKSYLVPFILITSLFLLWGFAHGLLDVLNKHFQGVFTMTKAESPFCDCLWALYSGNGSQPLFHDFRAGGIGGATPEFVSIV